MQDDMKHRIHKIEGTILKKLRKERGLTQEGLAKLIGTDPHYLSNLENGRRGIGGDIKQRVCAHFDVPLSLWEHGLINITKQEMNRQKSLIDLDIEQLLAKLPEIKKYEVAKYIHQLLEES